MNVAEQYEALRTAALGAPLALEARNGLAIFLRRGMWSWARATAAPSTPARPTRTSALRSARDDGQRAVIHLFAALAMRSRRTHERIAQGADASSRT
jgi:hypothetical protein